MSAPNENKESLKFKVVFVGDSTVGKTSIIHRYLNLEDEIPSTVGATSTRIDTTVKNRQICLNVWDTAGQETFRNLVPVYAKGAQAAVIVFDQSNKTTYEHVTEWYSYLQQHVGNIIVFIAQNKCDLEAQIDVSEVFSWADTNHVQVIPTSAKDGTGVNTLFESLSKSLYDSVIQDTTDSVVVNEEETKIVEVKKEKTPEKTEKKGCC